MTRLTKRCLIALPNTRIALHPAGTLVAMPSDSPKVHASKPINFWRLAYVRCLQRKDTKDLIEDLEDILDPNANHSGSGTRSVNRDAADGSDNAERRLEERFDNFNALMKSKLTAEVKELERHEWRISVQDHENKVIDMAKKFVDVVSCAKDFIGTALSTNPHAALAWSGVCFALQVSQSLLYICGPCSSNQAIKRVQSQHETLVREARPLCFR